MAKPIPAWNRFPKIVQVQRTTELSLDWVPVIEDLVCRIYPVSLRAEGVSDVGFARVISGTHKLIADWDHIHTPGDLDTSMRAGDKIVDDPSDYDMTGQTFEYTVKSIENPAGIGYNAEVLLEIRGQAEAD